MITDREWHSLITYGLGIAKRRGYRFGPEDRKELRSLVTEIIADAIKAHRPQSGDLREWIKKKLQYRLRAYGRSIHRTRLRETTVAYRPSGHHVDRRGGDCAKMRASLQRPEQIATAPTPEPWKLIDDCDEAWFDEQLRVRVYLSPLQEPGWSPQREQEWEASWGQKFSEFQRSAVPRYTRTGSKAGLLLHVECYPIHTPKGGPPCQLVLNHTDRVIVQRCTFAPARSRPPMVLPQPAMS